MRMGLTRLAAVFALLFWLMPSAQAAKVPPIINTGDILHKVDELPAPLQAMDPEFKGWNIGYKCSHFGLFWATVWSWDCTLVTFKDDTYADFPEPMRAELAKEYPHENAQREFWEHRGALVLLVGLIVLIGIGAARRKG